MPDKDFIGADAVLKVFEEQDVDVIFGYPGAALIPIYDRLYSKARQVGIRCVFRGSADPGSFKQNGREVHRMAQATFTGADGLLKVFEQEGVNVVFGFPGGAVIPIYDKL